MIKIKIISELVIPFEYNIFYRWFYIFCKARLLARHIGSVFMKTTLKKLGISLIYFSLCKLGRRIEQRYLIGNFPGFDISEIISNHPTATDLSCLYSVLSMLIIAWCGWVPILIWQRTNCIVLLIRIVWSLYYIIWPYFNPNSRQY